jgi:hypothetical protein
MAEAFKGVAELFTFSTEQLLELIDIFTGKSFFPYKTLTSLFQVLSGASKSTCTASLACTTTATTTLSSIKPSTLRSCKNSTVSSAS